MRSAAVVTVVHIAYRGVRALLCSSCASPQLARAFASRPAAALQPFPAERVLFSDDALMVINKPSGLAVQRGTGVQACLLDYLQTLPGAPPTLYPVHRLDKGASGCVVVACTQAVAAALSEDIRHKRMKRTYYALLRAHPSHRLPKAGTLRALLAVQSRRGKERMAVAQPAEEMAQGPSAPEGQRSQSRFEVVARSARGMACVSLLPHTGRKHQLRVHCSQLLGAPIVGDLKYGDRILREHAKVPLMLHARTVQLRHPVTRRALEVRAPFPAHFRDMWRQAGLPGEPEER